jgi:hypothetical protein
MINDTSTYFQVLFYYGHKTNYLQGLSYIPPRNITMQSFVRIRASLQREEAIF